jgi:hypothetical protein
MEIMIPKLLFVQNKERPKCGEFKSYIQSLGMIRGLSPYENKKMWGGGII